MDATEQERTVKNRRRLPDDSAEEVAAPISTSKGKGLRKPKNDKMFRGALTK